MAALPMRSPIALVHGHFKVYLSDPSLLEGTLRGFLAAEASAMPVPGPAAWLSDAARRILDAAGSSCRGRHLRSLRDVAFHLRGSLPNVTIKFVQQINSAYALFRHVPQSDIDAKVDALILAIGSVKVQTDCQQSDQQAGGANKSEGAFNPLKEDPLLPNDPGKTADKPTDDDVSCDDCDELMNLNGDTGNVKQELAVDTGKKEEGRYR